MFDVRTTVLWLALCLASTGCNKSADSSVNIDLEPSIRDLGNDDLTISEPALDRILALGPAVIPALEKALHEQQDHAVRVAVVDALYQLRVAEAVPPMIWAAENDPHPEVRREALQSLAILNDQRATSVALKALSDKDSTGQLGGLEACMKLCRTIDAVQPTLHMVLQGQDRRTMIAARKFLALLREQGDADAKIAAKNQVIEKAPAALEAESQLARVGAALLLADVNDDRGHTQLEEVISSTQPVVVKRQALSALGRIGSDASVPAILGAVDEVQLRTFAYSALKMMAMRKIEPAQKAIDNWKGPTPPFIPIAF